MKLGGIVTAMVTPFADDGTVNYEEAGRIAKWLVDRGNDGLVRRRNDRRRTDAQC